MKATAMYDNTVTFTTWRIALTFQLQLF